MTPSPSTEESVSAYIERTLEDLGPHHEVRFLSPIETGLPEREPEQETSKASFSDAVVKPVEGDEGLPGDPTEFEMQEEGIGEASRFKLKADFFQTDTSEIEDLYDSAGADATTFRPTIIASGAADPEEGKGL